jgi:uncharacterized membrane protein
MFGKRKVGDTAGSAVAYVDPLVKDEKLRARLVGAVRAAGVARQQVQRQTGVTGTVQRLAADPMLRTQLRETVRQLQAARIRARKVRGHRRRKLVLFLTATGVGVAAAPSLRRAVASRLKHDGGSTSPSSGATVNGSWEEIEDQIELDVPVTTAYNQWTQFEEFPRFMAGIEEVRQLDDTLLHWAASVGGTRAEWDAKIIEQEPDRRISWESTDGRKTRGTVTFDEAGSGRSRIRLHMSYRPESAAESVGSALGIDKSRIRGDLERFRDLIEARSEETGSWRGTIKGGETRPKV